jgi:hypothetical protein
LRETGDERTLGLCERAAAELDTGARYRPAYDELGAIAQAAGADSFSRLRLIRHHLDHRLRTDPLTRSRRSDLKAAFATRRRGRPSDRHLSARASRALLGGGAGRRSVTASAEIWTASG